MQTDRATLLAALISPNNPLNWRSFNSTGIPGKSRTEISRGEDLFPEQVHEDEEERRRRRREKKKKKKREGRPHLLCSHCQDKSA